MMLDRAGFGVLLAFLLVAGGGAWRSGCTVSSCPSRCVEEAMGDSVYAANTVQHL